MANSRKSPSIDDTGDLSGGLKATLAACLQRHVNSGNHVAVALSGGLDSVALLHACAAVLPRGGLSAVHVNHGLSTNASAWERFCADYARHLDIPFSSVTVAVERGSSDGLEAAARRARHTAFSRIDADWIVLAHHRDDQAETLLFNLLRGTGIGGAGAMRERNGCLLRPLLNVGRDDIRCYADEHRLAWIEDESNADTRYSRNFLRHGILAPLLKRFPAAVKNLAAASARFAEAQDLLNVLARTDLGTVTDFPVPTTLFRALDEPRARNALRYLLAQHGVQIPSEARLREGLRQMLMAGPDRHPAQNIGEYRLYRCHGKIYLEPWTPLIDKR